MIISKTDVRTQYDLDVVKSTMTWAGKKVIGGSHSGNLKLGKGIFSFEDGNLLEGSFEVDMTSITNTDLTDAEYNGKLVGHLKADDFFNVATYPTASFIIRHAAVVSVGKYHIIGDLTIKGITNSINFPAVVTLQEESLIAEAKISVDRTRFNIKYGSNSFFDNLGDKAISNNFDINLHLEAKRKES